MMRAEIGIIGAMEPEVEELISLLSERSSEVVSGITFNLGVLDGKRVVIARCGIGKVFASLCAEAMILKYNPSLIINTGVGGAVKTGLSTGDIVIADKLCQHDMDTSAIGDPIGLVSGINLIYFNADNRAVEILKDSAMELSLSATVGTVATGDRFIASASDKAKIAEGFSACACEMEGCAIAQTAYVNGVAFAVIRAISDSADGKATMDYPVFLPIAARNSARLTRALVSKW